MKIVNIQFIGGNKLAITDTGEGIPFENIKGSISVGATLEKENDGYKIGIPIVESCDTWGSGGNN